MTPTMRQNYPHTPEQILAYDSNKLREAFHYQGEEKVRLAIDDLFRIVSEITLVPSEALPERLGFQANNQDRNNFQALLGVMRTVKILHHLGFVEIQPLRPHDERPEADLLAMRQDVKFAVEVFRSNEDTPRYLGLNLEEYIGRRYKKDKKTQLDETMSNHICSKTILVVVFDSKSSELFSRNDLQEAARESFREMGFPDKTHLIVFSEIEDDMAVEDGLAIFPELPP